MEHYQVHTAVCWWNTTKCIQLYADGTLPSAYSCMLMEHYQVYTAVCWWNTTKCIQHTKEKKLFPNKFKTLCSWHLALANIQMSQISDKNIRHKHLIHPSSGGLVQRNCKIVTPTLFIILKQLGDKSFYFEKPGTCTGYCLRLANSKSQSFVMHREPCCCVAGHNGGSSRSGWPQVAQWNLASSSRWMSRLRKVGNNHRDHPEYDDWCEQE
jgi:hypothetical protein